MDRIVQESALELESLIKQKVLSSSPTGKTYRRGAIKRRAGIAGYKFHRASRKGQPFANDTGETLNATRAQKTGPGRARVLNSKKHAKLLDDKNKLDRPFFASTAEEFREKFKQNLRDALVTQ